MRCLLISLLLSGTMAAASAAEIFIVHPDLQSVSLSAADIAEVLHGRRTTWPNGVPIALIALEDQSSATMTTILKEFARKSPAQFLAYWKRQVFTSKGAMPRIATNEVEMLTLVSSIPGALGFIDDRQLTEAVRALTIR